MAPADSSNPSTDVIEIERTLEFLTKGKENIRLDEHYRNLTLVLGVTGSGKSTFVQWLAGDNAKLISKLVPGTRDNFIIKDDSRISNSTTQSMTIYPELVVDPVTDFAYYDCPGFSDTRNASVDIAGTYFIKSVADYAQNVRTIFTVGHDAVKVGSDRIAFPTLLKHSTNLVKNVDKYRNSIALVVTKVANNAYPDENGIFVYETDKEIIDSIANFMNEVKKELKNDNKKSNENYIKFIDALLQRNVNDQSYSRIAIFRKPNKAGPLSEIPLLKNGKVELMKMVKQLELTPTEENDFGYSISGDSKKTVLELANIINNRVWEDAETIAKVVAETFRPISIKIDSFVTAPVSVDANLVEAQSFASKLNATDLIVSQLSVPNVTTKVLAEKLKFTLNALEIETVCDNVDQISQDANHLEFLQNVMDSKLVTKPWNNLLNSIVDSLTMSKGKLQSEINASTGKLVATVQATIKSIADDLWVAKLKQMQSMDIHELLTQLEQQAAILQNQTELQPSNIGQLAKAFSMIVESFGMDPNLLYSKTFTLSNSGKYLNYLQVISDHPLTTWSPEWTSTLKSTVKSFYDSLDWYRFLNGLYSKLGEYQFQQDPSRYNVANLDDWGNGLTKTQDIRISELNFKQFLDITSQYNISGRDAIKNIQVTQWQLNELNQMLRLTLKHGKSRSDCSEKGQIRVTGDYVKFSELKPKLVDMCPGSVTTVNIFSSNKVFIDADLDGLGDMLKITVFAPNWEVVGNRKIQLDGSSAFTHKVAKANNGVNPGNNGDDGKPGFPGGSAGHFLGFGESFVNVQALTVTANGAVGGAGQAGGDGQPSADGHDSTAIPTSCRNFVVRDLRVVNVELIHGWHHFYFILSGTKAQNGGSGGNGGAGGIGGRSGQIELYNTNRIENIEMNFENNMYGSGINGRGGLGKDGGKNGNDVWLHCKTNDDNAYESYYYPQAVDDLEFVGFKVMENTRANSGKDGITGANRANIEQPKSVETIDYAIKVTEYKQYLSDSSKDGFDRFKRHSIRSFVEQLKDNKKVNELYVDDFLNYLQKSIDKLRRQQQHSEYEIAPPQLTNYSTANSNSTEFRKINAFDAQLLSVANERNTPIGTNFALQQYDAVVVALKQLVFPYAHFYLDEGGFSRNSADVEYLVSNIIASLEKMRLSVILNRRSIWQVDQYAYRANFDSFHLSTSPFYVWSNDENRNAIRQLLLGESIVFNADIRLSDPNKDAIKFSLVEINLKTKNNTTQAEIDAELNKFMITATHMGNSNYRYGDKYYRINSAPVDIEYSFAKDINGRPMVSNDVYSKISNGDLMLSPYAEWQIRLTKMNETDAFESLAKYLDHVDLELVGQGIFSDSQRARSDYLQVERYYSEYETKSQSNVTEVQQLTSAKVMKVSNSLHRSSDRVPTQAINSTGALSYMSRLGETVSNLFGSNSTVNNPITHPRFDYTPQHNDTNNTNLSAASNSVDVLGNLLMSQLLVGLITGKNNTITNESYISPEQTRAVQVDSLAQRIVPALSQSSATRSSQLYNSNNQWHRDLMSENVTSREHN